MCVEKHTDRYQCIQRQCDRQRRRLRGVLQTCHYNLSLLFPYVLISEREMRIGLKRRGQRVHLTADLQRLVAPVMKGNAPLLLSGALVQQSVLTHVTASTGRACSMAVFKHESQTTHVSSLLVLCCSKT